LELQGFNGCKNTDLASGKVDHKWRLWDVGLEGILVPAADGAKL
jgi:hypothetical protein